jgi:hypothetical protein
VEHGGHYEIKWDVADDFHGAGAADEEDQPTTDRRPLLAARTCARLPGVSRICSAIR